MDPTAILGAAGAGAVALKIIEKVINKWLDKDDLITEESKRLREELRGDLARLREELKDAYEARNKATNDLNEALADIGRMTVEKTQLESKIKILLDDVSQKTSENQSLQERLKDLENRIQIVTEERDRLVRRVVQIEEDHKHAAHHEEVKASTLPTDVPPRTKRR
jgi:chromosome segregation ATPase